MNNVFKNVTFRIIISFSLLLTTGLSPLSAVQDSSANKKGPPSGGVFSIMSDLTTGKSSAKDAFGNHGMDSAEFEAAKGSSGIMADSAKLNGSVNISYFSIFPKKPISAQKEAAYKGVLEEARRKLAHVYSTAIDTTKRIQNHHGDIKLKVFLDSAGKVTSCSLEHSTIKAPVIRQATIDGINELNFKPVHDNHKIKGFIVMLSFIP